MPEEAYKAIVNSIQFRDGMGQFVDPQTGEVVPVRPEETRDALLSGLRPASSDAVEKWVRQQQIDADYAGRGTEAVLLGGISALTLGLGPAVMAWAGGEEEKEHQRLLREHHGGKMLAADIIGTVGGIATGVGLPGLVAKGASRLGSRAAARLGGEAAGTAAAMGATAVARPVARSVAIPKLAEAIVREGTIGGAIGAGQAMGQVALSDNEMGGLESLAAVAKGAGQGALFGIGLGALGVGAGALARKAASKWPADVAKLRLLRGERDYLRASVARAEARGQRVPVYISARISELGGAIAREEQKVAGGLFSSVIAGAIGWGIAGPAGGAFGGLASPWVVRGIRRVIAGQAYRGARRAMGGAEAGIKDAWLRASEKGADLAVAGSDFATKLIPKGKLAQTTRAMIMTPSVMALTDVDEGKYTREDPQGSVRRLTAALTRKAFPHTAADKAVDVVKKNTDDIVAAIHALPGPEEFGSSLEMAWPANTPQGIREVVGQRVVRAAEYLKRMTPRPAMGGIPTEGAQAPMSDKARRRAFRRIEAVLAPDRVLANMDKATMDHVEALYATHPELMREVRAVIAAELEAVRADGKVVPRSAAKAIAMITQSKPPRMDTPEMGLRLRNMYAAAREGAQQSRPSGTVRGLADTAETTMQRVRRLG